MKKILSLVLALLFALNSPVHASTAGTVVKVFDATAVNDQDVATSRAIPVKSGGYFGVWYQSTSAASAPDIKIEYEMSWDETSGNFSEPVSASDVVTNLTAETIQVESVQPPPMAYIRFKATGNAGNAADTVLTMYFFVQGD